VVRSKKVGLDYIFGHVVTGSVPPVPGVDGAIRGMPVCHEAKAQKLGAPQTVCAS